MSSLQKRDIWKRNQFEKASANINQLCWSPQSTVSCLTSPWNFPFVVSVATVAFPHVHLPQGAPFSWCFQSLQLSSGHLPFHSHPQCTRLPPWVTFLFAWGLPSEEIRNQWHPENLWINTQLPSLCKSAFVPFLFCLASLLLSIVYKVTFQNESFQSAFGESKLSKLGILESFSVPSALSISVYENTQQPPIRNQGSIHYSLSSTFETPTFNRSLIPTN